MAQWYARNVSFPRYCKNPEASLQSLQVLLEEKPKIDNAQRRQHMIAAKILFMHPQQSNENQSDYLQRLRQLLLSKCR